MGKYLFVIVMLFFLGSCSSDASPKAENGAASSTPNQTPAIKTTEIKTDEHAGHNHSNEDGHDHSAAQGEDDINKFSGAYIGIWEYHPHSNLKKGAYEKHWIEINRDQTFECGIGKKVTNRGQWNLTKTVETYMEFDFEDNSKRMDEQWRSKVNYDVWTLVGNAPKMNTGEMLKLDKREQRPE